MRVITLTRGLVAIVDDEDFEMVSALKWYGETVRNTTYAFHRFRYGDRFKNVGMHRFILNAGPGQHVDHKDQNGLNNRRCNIRLCSPTENRANQKKSSAAAGMSSKYKGVCFDKQTGRWRAATKLHGKNVWLGRHASEEDAARAYNEAAVRLFGDFALLNEIPTP